MNCFNCKKIFFSEFNCATYKTSKDKLSCFYGSDYHNDTMTILNYKDKLTSMKSLFKLNCLV